LGRKASVKSANNDKALWPSVDVADLNGISLSKLRRWRTLLVLAVAVKPRRRFRFAADKP